MEGPTNSSTKIQFTFCFYVSAKTVFVSSFMSSGKELSEVQSKQVARHALQGLIVQHNNNVLERAKVTCSLHSEWEKYAT